MFFVGGVCKDNTLIREIHYKIIIKFWNLFLVEFKSRLLFCYTYILVQILVPGETSLYCSNFCEAVRAGSLFLTCNGKHNYQAIFAFQIATPEKMLEARWQTYRPLQCFFWLTSLSDPSLFFPSSFDHHSTHFSFSRLSFFFVMPQFLR